MARMTFVGGVHPYDGKELSKAKRIRDYEPVGDMVYPLSQHIGAPAKALVKKGDRVLVGQMIAEAGGFVSAPICSTVSGTVKAIEKHRVVTGEEKESIIIENDGLFEEIDWPEVPDFESLTREDKIKMIADAGIIGMGGAGFPTAVKLQPKEPDQIDYIIVNCA